MMKESGKISVKSMVLIAMLGALAFALMALNFPLPIFPAFLKFDVAELPSLFAGFFLGPVSGVLVILIKIGLKLLFQPTETGYIGELMNVAGSLAFVLPAALIYRFDHSKKGAGTALVVSTLIGSVAMVFLNKYVAFPMYSVHIPMEQIIAMGTKVMPFVKDETTLLWFSVFPFNLLKHAATALITWLMYKRVSKLMRQFLAK